MKTLQIIWHSNNILPEDEFNLEETCTCYWKLGNFLVVNSTFTPEPRSTTINLAAAKPIDLRFNENEHASLNFTYSFDERDSFVNVTWYRSEVAADDDDIKSERELVKYEIRQRLDSRLKTTDSLNLGKADLADSGNYQVTVYSPFFKKVIAEQNYSVKVYSKIVSNLELYVRDSVKENRMKKLNPKFLRINQAYRFYCKATAFPYPSLISYWTSCDSERCQTDSVNKCREKSCTSKWGTIESTLHWEANISTSGIFSCIANDTKTETIQIIVTDVNRAQENNGIQLDVIKPSQSDDVLNGDNISIQLSLQKQYTAVICWFNDSVAESTLIFKAFARSFADHPLQFASNWFLDTRNLSSKFKIIIDESSVYSNNIYMNVDNVSHSEYNGYVTCSTTDYAETVISNRLQLKVQLPVSPWFNPHPAANPEGYELQKPVSIPCGGVGVPTPKLEWFRVDTAEIFNGTILEIAAFNESFVGNYCCRIMNKAHTNISCVYIKKGKQPYSPAEFFSLDSLSKLIFVIMTACTVVLLTVTPMSFQRRTARKVRLLETVNRR